MLKVVFSSKLFSFGKFAAEDDSWLDKVVPHRTPTGQEHHVKVRSLPPEEQEKYRPKHPETGKATGFDMTVPQIQESIKQYRNPKSYGDKERTFAKLYKNFMPMIMNTVRERIQHLNPSKQDREDMIGKAQEIFVKLIGNPLPKKKKGEDDEDDHTVVADPDSPGVVSYIKKHLSNQLLAESRKVMEGDTKKRKSDILLQIAAKKFMRLHGLDPKEMTNDDYKHMARWINMHDDHGMPDSNEVKAPTDEALSKMDDSEKDFGEFLKDHPRSFRTRVNNATAEKIQNMLSSRVDSLDRPMGDDGDSRSLGDVLDTGSSTYGQPDTEYEETEIMDRIKKLEPEDQEIIQLTMDGYKPSEIGEKMGLHTKKVLRSINKLKKVFGGPKDNKQDDETDDDTAETEKQSSDDSAMLLIAAQLSKFSKIIYVPEKIEKSDLGYSVDGMYRIKRYSCQMVCDCGQPGCLHKDAVSKWIRQNEKN